MPAEKKLDPDKLAIVSDYLKRTIAERPYGFILASLSERLQFDKLDFNMRSMGLVTVPPDFDLRKFSEEKSIGFMPYCCKPFDCPMNATHGRKSQACLALEEKKCDHPKCSIERFVRIADKLGIQDYMIIDSDPNLFKWLAEKKDEGYKHVIGVACEFAVSYALEVIHVQLGYDGLIVLINGDKCKNKEEYAEMDSTDRGRLTFIDEWTISTLEEIIDCINSEDITERSKGSTAADR